MGRKVREGKIMKEPGREGNRMKGPGRGKTGPERE